MFHSYCPHCQLTQHHSDDFPTGKSNSNKTKHSSHQPSQQPRKEGIRTEEGEEETCNKIVMKGWPLWVDTCWENKGTTTDKINKMEFLFQGSPKKKCVDSGYIFHRALNKIWKQQRLATSVHYRHQLFLFWFSNATFPNCVLSSLCCNSARTHQCSLLGPQMVL